MPLSPLSLPFPSFFLSLSFLLQSKSRRETGWWLDGKRQTKDSKTDGGRDGFVSLFCRQTLLMSTTCTVFCFKVFPIKLKHRHIQTVNSSQSTADSSLCYTYQTHPFDYGGVSVLSVLLLTLLLLIKHFSMSASTPAATCRRCGGRYRCQRWACSTSR